MTSRTGIVNLPLHWGQTPRWLFERMSKLARQISLAIIAEYGIEEFIQRLSHPYWFQAFGCTLGFDWHSSGITTTVCGALKNGLKELQGELGIFICGGKGKTSLKTPQEIERYANLYQLPVNYLNLTYASKITAKVDNSALQDGFTLYHHTFIFTNSGQWSVIQQGMNSQNQYARRYHWLNLAPQKTNFTSDPHKAICCNIRTKPLNLVAPLSLQTQKAITYISNEKPEITTRQYEKIQNYSLTPKHPIYRCNIKKENLQRVLLNTYKQKPKNFEEVLGIRNVGPKTLRALTLIAELIYGAKPSFQDPVRYSFSHGGKDGFPYPIDKEEYDKSIDILKEAVNSAKIGNREKIQALERLINFS